MAFEVTSAQLLTVFLAVEAPQMAMLLNLERKITKLQTKVNQ